MFRTLLMLMSLLLAVDLQGLEDPTRPKYGPVTTVVSSGPAKPQAPRLNAILFSTERQVAIIDGYALGEGEERMGVRVDSITKDDVKVIWGGRRHTLRLADGTVKKEFK